MNRTKISTAKISTAVAGVLLCFGLTALTGCGGTDGEDDQSAQPAQSEAPSAGPASRSQPGSGSPSGAPSSGSASGTASGRSASPDGGQPAGANTADIKFVQLMIPHHDQAVEMSNILLGKADAQEDVAGLAQRIKDGQEPQIESLEGWLETTGGNPEPPEQDPFDTSNGMLAPEQMQQLDEADGPTASKAYLELMIKHHQGAIALAETEITDGADAAAVQHADDVRSTQQTEVKTMQEMLTNF